MKSMSVAWVYSRNLQSKSWLIKTTWKASIFINDIEGVHFPKQTRGNRKLGKKLEFPDLSRWFMHISPSENHIAFTKGKNTDFIARNLAGSTWTLNLRCNRTNDNHRTEGHKTHCHCCGILGENTGKSQSETTMKKMSSHTPPMFWLYCI